MTTRRSTGNVTSNPYLWTALLLWAVPALLVLVGYLTLPDYNSSGQCEGIGFGCSLTPKDSMQFLALFGAVPMLVVGLAVMALIALVRTLRRRDH